MAIDVEENMDRTPIVRAADDELAEPLTGCASTACCNPSSTLHRFIALIFMCLLGFGEFYTNFNEACLVLNNSLSVN